MPLYYLFGLEELEPRSPGEAVFLELLRCLLAGLLAALVGLSLLLRVVTQQERAREKEGRDATGRERDDDGAPAGDPLGLFPRRFGPAE